MTAVLGGPWSWVGVLGWFFLAALVGFYEWLGWRRKDDSWPTLTNLFKRLLPQPERDKFFVRVTDWLRHHFHGPGGTR